MLSASSTLRLNLTLALGYLILGCGGLMLGSPPSFASPIFPAAGLALAVVLVHGLRALPGAALGDFVLLMIYGWRHEGWHASMLAMACLSGLGAALRAWAGYWLIQRWQGDTWRVLEREQDAFGFVLLGGLVSGLVSASISVPAMQWLHGMAPSEVLYHWWTWYIGDALGIMLFTPLSLCFLLDRQEIWRDRRRRIVLPMLIATGLFCALFYATVQWEKRSAADDLQAHGNKIATQITDRLTKHREILASLRNFVEATPDLTLATFQQFTRHSLRENNDLAAFSVSEMVTATPPRQMFERFRVSLNVTSTAQDDKPLSESVRRRAIESALGTRQLSLTAPLLQVSEAGRRVMVSAFYPVYRLNNTHREGWTDAMGLVNAELYLDTMIEQATQGALAQGLTIQLRDVTDPTQPAVLFQSGKASRDFTAFSTKDIAWSTRFAAADRQWQLVLVPSDAFGALARPWGAWAVGVAGLLFATLLQILMLGMTGRTAVIQRNNRKLQNALARTLLADKVMTNSSEAIVVTDTLGRIESVNPAFSAMTTYSAQDIQGCHIRILKSDRHGPEFFERMWRDITTRKQWQGEIWNRRKNGDVFPAWMTISAVTEENGAISHYVGAFSDITAYKNARERIDFLAFHDVLTGLPNRVLGPDLLRQAISSATQQHQTLAVLCLGLDKFKHVNDSYGHATGDALLQEVVQRLSQCLRKTDLLCRLSGDEFMVVLTDVDLSGQVIQTGERILARMAEPFDLEPAQLTSSVSIGIALFPDHASDHELLIRHAEMAMFQAKKDGGNTQCVFHEQMNARILTEMHTRQALRLALQRDEFELYYQPQMDLASGRVLGVETLIRWNRPEQGQVSPAHFIATAEESGVIVPMGNWVLRQACRQAANWQHTGWGHLVVAVNISPVQFRRGQLETEVIAALQETGLEPERLELELTESLLLEDAESVLGTVNRLKALGIQLSIDDFGTGYSSLSYLQRFNVDKLKIDRSFVNKLSDAQGGTAIVSAMIQMAKSLNLKTLAEGVEDSATAEKLKRLGCDQVQGYLYANPLSAGELTRWLQTQPPGVD